MEVGNKVIWNDVAIDDFAPEERAEQQNRVYTIIELTDEMALIADEYGEAEVFLDEIEVI
jgi:hypothetical protein